MKPKEIMTPLQSAQAYLLDAEHELAAANDRIRLLISERDTARLQADQKIKQSCPAADTNNSFFPSWIIALPSIARPSQLFVFNETIGKPSNED